MSDGVALARLVEAVPAEARLQVERLLCQVAHDLNTPLATLTMELFSLQLLLDKLRASTEGRPESAKALAGAGAICANLERASASLASYIAVLSKLDSRSGLESGGTG